MAISKENMEKLHYLWQDENRVEFIETFIKIADKSGNIVPFILTPEQKEFLLGLEHQNVVLKSRQLGLSVVCVAESIREVVTRENCTCALISHTQSSCNAVFDKLKQMFNSLPDFIKPKQIMNNRQSLVFDNGSSIVCLTAGQKDILRGSTITGMCHCSEFAFYNDPQRHLKSLMQACSESSILVLESTANGYGLFSDTYFNAKNGKNSMKSFFFNWINGRTLFEPQYKLAVDKWCAANPMLTIDDLTDEEDDLVSLGATLDQIIWRRQKIATEGDETFRIEFPSVDVEAFAVTGSGVFNSKYIDRCIQRIISGNIHHIDKSKVVGLPSILQRFYGGSFVCYELPQPKEKYAIGVDCSEGVGNDYSVAVVINSSGKEIAMFRSNKIKPYEFAEVLNSLGRWYNKAKMCIEKASGGFSVIDRLKQEYHYMNLTKYKAVDDFNRPIYYAGFQTNTKTKSLVIADLTELFENDEILIRSRIIPEEMKLFVEDSKTGKMGAIAPNHDDTIMSLALAIYAMYRDKNWYPFN